MKDVDLATDGHRYHANQLLEREDLRSDGVDDKVVLAPPCIDGEAGNIIDGHRPHPVLAGAGNGEERQSAREPGDVVDENVAAAEEHAGPDDGVRQRRSDHDLLGERLPPEVGERRAP